VILININMNVKEKIVVLSFACLFMAGNVFAQSEEKKPQEGTPSSEIAAILLANDLAKYGYQNNSASSLIEAARILAQVPTQKFVAEKTEAGAKTEDKTEKAKTPEFTVANLLADAKELAAGDATLLALISDVEKIQGTATRGALGGPQVGTGIIYARSNMDYYVNFYAGRFAEVAVAGDGSTDLDLSVYDQNGNLIVSDTSYSGNAYVSWVPAWTGTFRIRVVNNGYVSNTFGIASN
jgi:hypothetical protein